MDVVAHRGFGDEYPENTRYAFERAAETADWIELDVRRCKTGELVVFHDETLDRLTAATGRIINRTWSELQDIEILDSGERIPSLEEALAVIPSDTGVEVELKEWGTATEALDTLAGVENPSSVISFSPLVLHAVTTHTPEMSLGHVLYDGLYQDAPAVGLNVAAHVGCDTVHLFHPMCVQPDVVEAAHSRGLAVQAATPANGPTDEFVTSCRDTGVDRISADRPVER